MADITRAEVSSLIGEEFAGTILGSATKGSTALQAFPTYNMGTKTTNVPVLATLPTAGWVTDTGNDSVKPTSQATWGNKTLVAEEIAVIVPIHENTLDDANDDILAELAAAGGQAIGKTLDQAVFFGTNKPASWTSADLLAAAVAASQDYEVVDGDANSADIYGQIQTAAGALADAGFDPTEVIAKLSLRYSLGNIRNANGDPILMGDNSLRGFSTYWSGNGAWDPAEATAFIVDPSRVRIGVRQDVQVKLLTEATITGLGNLAELDMVALRFKARFAYVLGVGATAEGASKTPVAAILPDTTS